MVEFEKLAASACLHEVSEAESLEFFGGYSSHSEHTLYWCLVLLFGAFSFGSALITNNLDKDLTEKSLSNTIVTPEISPSGKSLAPHALDGILADTSTEKLLQVAGEFKYQNFSLDTRKMLEERGFDEASMGECVDSINAKIKQREAMRSQACLKNLFATFTFLSGIGSIVFLCKALIKSSTNPSA